MITDSEAIDYLRARLAPDAEPQLSQAEFLSLIEMSKAVDVDGNSPGAAGYEPTWTYDSLKLAVYEGWVIKMGYASELNEGQPDEKGIFDHVKKNLDYWAGQVAMIDSSLVGGGAPLASVGVVNLPVW